MVRQTPQAIPSGAVPGRVTATASGATAATPSGASAAAVSGPTQLPLRQVPQPLQSSQARQAAILAGLKATEPASDRTKNAVRAAMDAKKKQTRWYKLQETVPQEINILGEQVRLFADKQFKGRAGAASFQREYFPEANEERLKFARSVFAAVFGPKSKFSLETPLYPCDPAERDVLKEGLVRRFYGLRASLLELMDQEDIKILEKKEAYEHLMRLKQLIETMDKIYEESNGACIDNYDPASGRLSVPMDELEEKGLRNLLRQFVFLVLQGSQPLENWKQRQAMDPVDLLERLKEQDITDAEMAQYLEERTKTGYTDVPVFLHNLLQEIQSKDVGTALAMDAEFKAVYDQLKGILHANAEGNTGRPEKIGKIDGMSEPYRDKLIKLINLFQEFYQESTAALTKAQADLADCEKQAAASKTALDNKEKDIKGLQTLQENQEDELRKLMSQLEGAIGSGASAGTPPEKLLSEIQALTQQLIKLRADAETLRAEKEKAATEAATASGRVEGARVAEAKARGEVEDMKTKVATLERQNRTLETTLMGQHQELQKLQQEKATAEEGLRRCSEEMKRSAVELAALRRQQEGMKAEQARQITELQGQLTTRIAQFTQGHRTELAAKHAEVTGAREQINAATARHAELERLRDELQANRTGAERRATDAEARLTAIQGQLAELQGTQRTSADQLRIAAQERAALQAEIDRLKAAATKGDADAAENLAEKQAELAAASAQVVELNKTAERDRAEIVRLQATQANLDAQIKAFDEQKADLNTRIAAADTKVADMERAQEQLRQQLQTAQADFTRQLAESRDKLAAEEGKHTAAIGALKAEQLAALAQKQAEYDQKFAAEQARLNGLIAAEKEKFNVAERAYNEQKATLEAQIQKLNGDIAAQKTAYDAELAKQKLEFDARLKTKQDELDKANREKAELQANLDASRREVAARDLEIQQLRNEIEKLEEIIESKNQLIVKMQGNIDELKTEVGNLNAEVTELHQELEEMTGLKEAAEARIVELEGDLRRCNETVEEFERQVVRLKDQLTASETAYAELRDGAKAEQQRLTEQLTQNQTALESVQKELETEKGTSASLESTRVALVKEQERIKADLAKAKRDLAASEAARAAILLERDTLAASAAAKHQEQATESQQERTGLLAKVLELAQAIQADDNAKIETIVSGNPAFTQIYNNMRGIQQVLRPDSILVCYMRFFVDYFIRTLFFSGEMLDQRRQTYSFLKKKARDFLNRQGDDPSTDWKRYLEEALPEMFDLLKAAETPRMEKKPANETRQEIRTNLQKFLLNKFEVGQAQAIAEFFVGSFPASSALAKKALLKRVSYPLFFAFYLALAQQYLNVISTKLAEYKCPIPKFLQVSLPQPTGEPRFEPEEGSPTAPVISEAPTREPISTSDDVLAPAENLFGTPTARVVASTPGLADDYATLGLTEGVPLNRVVLAFRKAAYAVHPKRTDKFIPDRAPFMKILGAYMRIRASMLKKPAPTEEEINRVAEDLPAVAVAPAAAPVEPVVEPAPQQPLSKSAKKRAYLTRKGARNAKSGATRPEITEGNSSSKKRRTKRKRKAFNAAVAAT